MSIRIDTCAMGADVSPVISTFAELSGAKLHAVAISRSGGFSAALPGAGA